MTLQDTSQDTSLIRMANKLPTSVEDVRIKTMPASAYYIADFLSELEEEALLRKINTVPIPRWKNLSKRRLQSWPSELVKGDTLLDATLPAWLLKPIIPRILSIGLHDKSVHENVFSGSPHLTPNHVLINEYHPGQGIMPHKDGPAYYPTVCTVSLGASLCLDIYGTDKDGTREINPRWKILQEPRSLLVITGSIYTDFLHGIADVTEDVSLSPDTVANYSLLRSPDDITDGSNKRQLRTSITFRDVLKVSKLGNKFDLLSKR